MKKMETKSVEFSKEQYFALLKAVYLGNWMANAQRDGSVEDPHVEEYENISDYVFSLAPLFGLEKYMTHEDADGARYFPTRLFEEGTDVDDLHDEYDDETFWDELCDALGERDFHRKYTPAEIKKMSREERFTKLYECIGVYDEEFMDNGIERLKIKEETQNDNGDSDMTPQM